MITSPAIRSALWVRLVNVYAWRGALVWFVSWQTSRCDPESIGKSASDETLAFLDVSRLLDHRAHQLSNGEAKRVEMALAFARNPECLLADEILRSADPILRDQLGQAMRALAKKGCAVVVTGHEVSDLMPFLDSVTWVTSGTTYDLGSPESACANERFAREYLGAARSTASSS